MMNFNRDPDIAEENLLKGHGEFSINVEIAFDRHIERMAFQKQLQKIFMINTINMIKELPWYELYYEGR